MKSEDYQSTYPRYTPPRPRLDLAVDPAAEEHMQAQPFWPPSDLEGTTSAAAVNTSIRAAAVEGVRPVPVRSKSPDSAVATNSREDRRRRSVVDMEVREALAYVKDFPRRRPFSFLGLGVVAGLIIGIAASQH